MYQPCNRYTAVNIQKIKHMIRKYDTADHQPDHRCKNRKIEDQLKNTKWRIGSF